MRNAGYTVQLNRLDDLVEIIWNSHGPICIRSRFDSTRRKNLVEHLLIGCVVSHSCCGIFQLMAGQICTRRGPILPMIPSARNFLVPATLAALAGSQPMPPAPTLAFASRIS